MLVFLPKLPNVPECSIVDITWPDLFTVYRITAWVKNDCSSIERSSKELGIVIFKLRLTS